MTATLHRLVGSWAADSRFYCGEVETGFSHDLDFVRFSVVYVVQLVERGVKDTRGL